MSVDVESLRAGLRIDAKPTPTQLRRRQRILEAAEKMVLEQGYSGASMKNIADAADVTEKTLYNIYGTKAELIGIVFRQRTTLAFEKASAANPDGGLPFMRGLVREIARSSLEIPAAARRGIEEVMIRPEVGAPNDPYQNSISDALDDMYRDGVIAEPKYKAFVSRRFKYGMLSGLVLWSNDLLSNDELTPYLELQMNEGFLPYATPEFAEEFRRDLLKNVQEIGRIKSERGEDEISL